MIKCAQIFLLGHVFPADFDRLNLLVCVCVCVCARTQRLNERHFLPGPKKKKEEKEVWLIRRCGIEYQLPPDWRHRAALRLFLFSLDLRYLTDDVINKARQVARTERPRLPLVTEGGGRGGKERRQGRREGGRGGGGSRPERWCRSCPGVRCSPAGC